MKARNWWLYLGIAGFLGYFPSLPGELRLLNLLFLTPLAQASLPVAFDCVSVNDAPPQNSVYLVRHSVAKPSECSEGTP